VKVGCIEADSECMCVCVLQEKTNAFLVSVDTRSHTINFSDFLSEKLDSAASG